MICTLRVFSPIPCLDGRIVAEIGKATKRSGQHKVLQFFNSKNNKYVIVSWKSDLNRIFRVFNVCTARSSTRKGYGG